MLKYTYLKGQMQTDYHLEPSLEKSPFLWMLVSAVWQNKQQEKNLIQSPALLHLVYASPSPYIGLALSKINQSLSVYPTF